MPALSQRLGKPSRSYLAGIGEDGTETGSVMSYRSGGSNFSQQPRRSGQNGSVAGSQTGSVKGSRFSTTGSISGIMRGRQSAASDIGRSNSQTMPAGRSAGDRRSVTFSDLSPAMFDERERLTVMSDIGGYGPSKRRTPSIASSMLSNDNASDAGSTMSTRRSVRRGSRSDRVAQPPQSLNLWHNDLGGSGVVSPSGSGKSFSNPLSSIVKRKSTLGTSMPITGDSQPSRRYSTGPAATSSSASASGALPTQRQSEPRSLDAMVLPSAQGMRSGIDANGRSYEIPPMPPMPADATRPDTLQRSSSSGSTSSRKSNRGAGQAPTPSLHSATLRNNLMNVPPPPVSPGKRRTRERVMEVVQEAEEEPEPERPSRIYAMNGHAPEVSVTGPTPSHTMQDLRAAAEPSELPYTAQEQSGQVPAAAQIDEPTAPTQPAGQLDALPSSEPNAPAYSGRSSTQAPSAESSDVTHLAEPLHSNLDSRRGSANTEASVYSQVTEVPDVYPANVANNIPQTTEIAQPAEPSQEHQLTAARLAIQAAEQSEQSQVQRQVPVQSAYQTAEMPALHTRDSSVSTIGRSPTPGFDNFVTPPSTPPHSPSANSSALPADPFDRLQDGQSRQAMAMPEQVAPVPSAASPPASESSQRHFEMLVPAGTMPMPSHQGNPLRLESLSLSTTTFPTHASRSLSGTMLILSSYANAAAFVRLTANGWATYEEVEATSPEAGSADGQEFARYSFNWHIPPGTGEADIHYVLRLEDRNTSQVHWDNNNGRNYTTRLPPLISSKSNISRASSTSRDALPEPVGNNTMGSVQEPVLTASAPPQVTLTRTLSDASQSPNMLYDPKRASIASIQERGVLAHSPVEPQHEPALQSNGMGQYVPVSQVPFPAPIVVPHQRSISDNGSALSSATSTPTGSLNGDARTTPATSVSTMQQPLPSAIPKHVLHERAATEPGTGQTVSRDHSTASRTSIDSANQTFTYPSSRNSSYAASVASSQQNHAQLASHRSRPSTEIYQHDLPSIMSALEQYPASNAVAGGAVNGQNLAQDRSAMPSRSSSMRSETASLAGQSSRSVSTARRGYAENATVPPVPKIPPGSAIAAGVVAGPSTQSTMRALTVTSNAAQTLNRGFFKNNQQKTLRQNPRLSQSQMGSNATIAFSNLARMPMKIRSDECLVQVFAAGLDFWDRAKVDIMSARGQGYGFIPGRAFVGKVIETGTDVNASKVKRGDFVYGLNDLKKSGACGDYIAVQRTLLTQAPNGALSLEQIAAVALSGIAAFQAMDELCSTLTSGSKLVILNAHEGVGAIALQLSQSLRTAHDLWIVAHYPQDFADGDSILRALGASETLCGEVVSAVQSLRESSYDAVLDTIGGRKIYDASKVILHDDAYFVTTVGDALSVPTAKANWKVSLKAIFKRNEKKKNIAYWFPSLDQDARAALDRLREISEAGQLTPVVKRVYKFEDGANAFKNNNEQAIVMVLDQDKLMNGINSSTQ